MNNHLSDIGKGYERHDGDGSRGGRHGGFANEDMEDGDHPRRSYEHRSLQAMVNLLKGVNLESRNLDQDVNSCGNNEKEADKRNQVLGVLFHNSIAMP
ncbi:hypothetical protein Hanom_Chr10g00954131 [Helianthus anomalus]